MRRSVLALTVVAMAAGGCSQGVHETAKKSPLDHSEDVKVVACQNQGALGPKAVVQVVNGSSKPSNYVITVAFESPDGKVQYATGTAIVSTLAPGQKGRGEALALTPVTSKFVCKVTEADRMSAVG